MFSNTARHRLNQHAYIIGLVSSLATKTLEETNQIAYFDELSSLISYHTALTSTVPALTITLKDHKNSRVAVVEVGRLSLDGSRLAIEGVKITDAHSGRLIVDIGAVRLDFGE